MNIEFIEQISRMTFKLWEMIYIHEKIIQQMTLKFTHKYYKNTLSFYTKLTIEYNSIFFIKYIYELLT